jgi:hypothetical protein
MKSFIDTLQLMHGKKGAYRLIEIQTAYNEFIQKQIVKASVVANLTEQKYYTVSCPKHKWNGKLVRSSMTKNPAGLVPIYIGSNIDHIHYSFLI